MPICTVCGEILLEDEVATHKCVKDPKRFEKLLEALKRKGIITDSDLI